MSTVVLKLIGFLQVGFNGEMLKDFEVGTWYDSAFLVYNLMGKMRAAGASVYRESLSSLSVPISSNSSEMWLLQVC